MSGSVYTSIPISPLMADVNAPPQTRVAPLTWKDYADRRNWSTTTYIAVGMTLLSLLLATLLGKYGQFTTVHSPPPNKAILPSEGLSRADGIGRLPFMGFNTWNAFYCDINENLILEHAKLMKSLGLVDLGYNYLNIDDCYSEKKRNSNGDIEANKERFPSGMKKLTDQIHALGMKAGIYSDSGWFTCQLYPGSFQNEARDAKLFQQDWGFDLLKYDNCAVPFDTIIREGMVGKFKRMSDAIRDLAKTSGKPSMLFSLCQWGREEPWLWARQLGHTWRTTNDIWARWDALSTIINKASFYSWASDFYGHNDLDMLEVGNGNDLTYEESKAHFSAWALMKSPLLIGTDLRKITKEALEVLSNREIIAIHQDPVVGTGITPFRWGLNPDWTYNASYPAQYWSGNSQNGTVFMLLNVLNQQASMSFNFTESPWMRAGRGYTVRDLWSHSDLGVRFRNLTLDVPAHGVRVLLLQDHSDEPDSDSCVREEWCMYQNGTFAGPTHD